MLHRLEKRLEHRLAEKQAAGLMRQTMQVESPCGVNLRVQGSHYLAFCSNDYLGLAGHEKIRETLKEAVDRYGVGSGASHLVSGHSIPHGRLEEELAEFCGRSNALLFSSGYMANLGIASALLEAGDHVFEDKLNHASLLDAGLASSARFKRYLHGDVGSLEKKLQNCEPGEGLRLVMSDGVFSMDGDVAPLQAISSVCQKYDAAMMVDDAHGFGVLGEKGFGCTEVLSLKEDVAPILMCTLGKALGTFGAFVAGSEALVENLRQFSRTYIYTTALPPALAEASRCALRLLTEESWRREKLHDNIALFKKEITGLGLECLPSDTPIQPVLIGDNEKVVRVGDALKEKGILVGVIRPPTVPDGTARLRITLSAEHSAADIDRLLQALKECCGG